jgi:hypothetical protein
MHVDPATSGGKAGVGMCIERYEPLQMRYRWVS